MKNSSIASNCFTSAIPRDLLKRRIHIENCPLEVSYDNRLGNLLDAPNKLCVLCLLRSKLIGNLLLGSFRAEQNPGYPTYNDERRYSKKSVMSSIEYASERLNRNVIEATITFRVPSRTNTIVRLDEVLCSTVQVLMDLLRTVLKQIAKQQSGLPSLLWERGAERAATTEIPLTWTKARRVNLAFGLGGYHPPKLADRVTPNSSPLSLIKSAADMGFT